MALGLGVEPLSKRCQTSIIDIFIPINDILGIKIVGSVTRIWHACRVDRRIELWASPEYRVVRPHCWSNDA